MVSIGSNPASLTALVISSGITCAIVCMMPQIFDRESAHVLGIASTAFRLFSDWPTSGVFSAIGRGSSVAKEIRLVRFSSGPKTGFRTESIRPSHRTSRNNQTVTSTTIASTSKETTIAIAFQRSQCCEPPIALGLRRRAAKGNPVGCVPYATGVSQLSDVGPRVSLRACCNAKTGLAPVLSVTVCSAP